MADRVSQQATESFAVASSNARTSQQALEAHERVSSGNLRISQQSAETFSVGAANVRVSQNAIEALVPRRQSVATQQTAEAFAVGAGVARISQQVLELHATVTASNVRATQAAVESLIRNVGDLVTQQTVESLAMGNANAMLTQQSLEAHTGAASLLRLSQQSIEALIPHAGSALRRRLCGVRWFNT